MVQKTAINNHGKVVQFRPDRHAKVADPIEIPELPDRPRTHFVGELPIDFDDLIEKNYGEDTEKCLEGFKDDLGKRYARKWCWDESDDLAIDNGCRFSIRRAMHFAYSLRNAMQLWEGRWAGQPLILRTWQPEFLLRCFGWVRPHSEIGWVRRYSKAAVWVPKKHGKSPIGAAVGIYLWRFDGITTKYGRFMKEQGQHVYSVASNGKQAGIVQRHAINMVKHSQRLKQEYQLDVIKHHKTTSILTHIPSESTYEILAGDKGMSLDAGEGLNAGGIICDEAHVVDQKTVDVTTDAGASRDQFLWFQISTFGAGEGYGKRDLEYGRSVASGDAKDDGFLFRSYGAPDGTTDEQCGEEKTWKTANPNWGYTVNPRQFKDSHKRAANNPTAFSGFKQRRLNLWQQSSNPMLGADWWSKCMDPNFSVEEFHGQDIGAGLDLAVINDFAAFAMCYQDANEVYHLWVKLWMSDKFEARHRDKVDHIAAWGPEDIEVHHGEVQMPIVQDQISDLIEEYQISVLGYDAMFAVQMAQELEKRTSCEIVKYPQSLASYANPTKLFKCALEHGRLRHPGNRVLDWMAGNCQSFRRGELEMPVKSQDQPWAKIDGIQAAVMAIQCCHLTQGYDDGPDYSKDGTLFV